MMKTIALHTNNMQSKRSIFSAAWLSVTSIQRGSEGYNAQRFLKDTVFN